MSTVRIAASVPNTASASTRQRRQPTAKQIDLFLSYISEGRVFAPLGANRVSRERVARIKAAVNSLLDISYGNESPFNVNSALATLESFRGREIAYLNGQLEVINSQKENTPKRETVARSLDLLMRDFSITLRRDSLSIFMGNVRIRHNGMPHDLGDFTVRIKARCTNPSEIRFSGTKKVGLCQHPHIRSGVACYGSDAVVRNTLRAFLRAGELYDCALFLKDFLHSYNESGPFANIRNWQDQYCTECGELGSVCECDS